MDKVRILNCIRLKFQDSDLDKHAPRPEAQSPLYGPESGTLTTTSY